MVRPLIYVFQVYKHGRMSYEPLKICVLIDVIAISLSLKRLSEGTKIGPDGKKRKLKSVEKQEILRRIRTSLLKYLLRDPIFTVFTKKLIERVW